MLARKFRFDFAMAFFLLLSINLVRAEGFDLTNSVKWWGETVNGLQMSIEHEDSEGFVYCWVRNATTNELTCNLWALGRWDGVRVEVMIDGESKPLGRAAKELRGYDGIGPITRDVKHLLPEEVLHPVGFDVADGRVGSWIVLTNGNVPNGFKKPLLASAPTPSKKDATFVVDLLDFNWPTETLTNRSLQLCVIQSLAPILDNYNQSLESRFVQLKSVSFMIDGVKLRELMDKLADERPKYQPTLQEFRQKLERERSKTNSTRTN
jgi:hypothetical protein